MKNLPDWLCAMLMVGLLVGCVSSHPAPPRIAPPPAGSLYHGVFPGTTTGYEDEVSSACLSSYTQAVGQQVAWVYFSSEWGRDRRFPANTCEWIRATGAVPYIRLMLRSEYTVNTRETLFTAEKVLAGDFDQDIAAWAQGARAYGGPLLVEFGTECNGYWFPWNGKWLGESTKNGFGASNQYDGPERFVAMYRHIVTLMRKHGADNITWVFHIAVADDPVMRWNRFELYYPGDAYVDWLGVSVYGADSPGATDVTSFSQQLTPCYRRLRAMAPSKPIIIAEFGCASGSPAVTQDKWVREAFDALLRPEWPGVIGFSWWNTRFANDDNPAQDTITRVEDSPALAEVFRKALADTHVLHRPVIAE